MKGAGKKRLCGKQMAERGGSEGRTFGRREEKEDGRIDGWMGGEFQQPDGISHER